jgi:hypothetical protein
MFRQVRFDFAPAPDPTGGRDPGFCRRQSLVGCSGSGSENHRFRRWFDKPVGWLTHSGVAFPLVASLPTVLKATVGIGVAHAV